MSNVDHAVAVVDARLAALSSGVAGDDDKPILMVPLVAFRGLFTGTAVDGGEGVSYAEAVVDTAMEALADSAALPPVIVTAVVLALATGALAQQQGTQAEQAAEEAGLPVFAPREPVFLPGGPWESWEAYVQDMAARVAAAVSAALHAVPRARLPLECGGCGECDGTGMVAARSCARCRNTGLERYAR